jgi:DNA polymerase-3 subunit delta'
MPHALLIVSIEGLGEQALARWIAALVLCQSDAQAPCGRCSACQLLKADSHPDVHVMALEEKAQQIKIEQVRDVTEVLSLKSYRGGYKVGIIENAELLNTFSANAFLKTLEEPAGQTLLILVAKPSHRLPATIASRCTRISLRSPPLADGLAWLADQSGKPGSEAALRLAAGAPLMAQRLAETDLGELDRDMSASVQQLAAGRVDVSLLAERWLRSDPELRIIWLENWITQRVQAALAGAPSTKSAEPVRLPDSLLKPKIRPLFELLDAAREFRRLMATGLNQQLALEALLVGGRAALAS